MTLSISMNNFNFNNIEQLRGGGISTEPRKRKKITEGPRPYIPKHMSIQDMKAAIENTKQAQAESSKKVSQNSLNDTVKTIKSVPGNIPSLENMLDQFQSGKLDPRKIGETHNKYTNGQLDISVTDDGVLFVYNSYRVADLRGLDPKIATRKGIVRIPGGKVRVPIDNMVIVKSFDMYDKMIDEYKKTHKE